MNKMLRIKLALAGAIFMLIVSQSEMIAQQTPLSCGTTIMMNRLLDANPQLKQQYIDEENRLSELDKQAAANGYKDESKAVAPVYIIPVVFHVLEMGGTENISDAQIMDEVRILNNDYRKLNADTTNIVTAFRGIAADCQIQFRLAQKDPNGNCTNGIDRIFTTLTENADDASKLNDWTRSSYLNIWTVKSFNSTTLAGVAGYSYNPANMLAAGADGVIILSSYIGSIGTGTPGTSRALTHEIGHYLNLKHPWGGTNNPGVACGDDGVTDTPVTKGYEFACPLTNCSICNASIQENVQNYMEYSYCSNMFTAGQRTRMRNALASNTAQRSTLWSAANLVATGVSLPAVLCQADFQSNSITNILCQGDSIKFNDISWNGNPTAWSWTFPGGTPATSTDSVPTVTYNTPGTYNVSLTVSNASGSVSTTKSSYIKVNSSVAAYNASFYSEGFENAAIPNNDWAVINTAPGGNTWVQTSTASATGSKSVMIANVATADGNVDDLISPSIDMTTIVGSNPTLTFKVANAQRVSTNVDKLQVYISYDCGKNWWLRYVGQGTGLSTGGVQTGNFVPSASQWVQKSISMSGYTNYHSIYVKFRFTSNGGNNIYIDDININGTAGVDELSNNINYSIYPNPANENTIVDFNLVDKEKVSIKINDVVGREIATIFNGELNEGQHQYLIGEGNKLSSGVYFVTLTAGAERFTKKLIVK